MIRIPLLPILSGMLFVGTRLSGVVLFAPFFGSTAIPMRLKAIFTLFLSAVIYPAVEKNLPATPPDLWPVVAVSELFVGMSIGFVASTVCEGAQLAGQLLGIQVGYSLVNILDPQTEVESSVLPSFYQGMSTLMFLNCGVYRGLLEALGGSFYVLPPAVNPISGSFTRSIVTVAAQIFILGVRIAAPVLVLTMAVDIVLGLLGKVSPQLPLMLLGPAVKSVCGVLVLSITVLYWPNLFEHLFADKLSTLSRLVTGTR